MSFKGVALVTGAAQGIGRAIALRLAADGFGVAINDILPKKAILDGVAGEITAKGRKCVVVAGDISLETEVKDMVHKTVKELEGLDVMVANAGICTTKSFLDTTVNDWDQMFATNVRGTFLCYKYAGLQMIEQGRGGRIIGASSVAGKRGHAMLSAYSSSKFAIRGLTQNAAIEFGKYDITVNAYAPGLIITSMSESIGLAMGDLDGFMAAEEKNSVLGYHGIPEDVACTVSYLASKEARFITGQSVSVNGGRYFD